MKLVAWCAVSFTAGVAVVLWLDLRDVLTHRRPLIAERHLADRRQSPRSLR